MKLVFEYANNKLITAKKKSFFPRTKTLYEFLDDNKTHFKIFITEKFTNKVSKHEEGDLINENGVVMQERV